MKRIIATIFIILLGVNLSVAAIKGNGSGNTGTCGWIVFGADLHQLPIPTAFTASIWTLGPAPSTSNGYTKIYGVSKIAAQLFDFIYDCIGCPPAAATSSNTYIVTMTGANFTANKWHNLVTLWDGSTLSIYLDGVFQNSGSAASVGTNTGLLTGLNDEVSSQCWAGSIAEESYWNVALTPNEIKSLYSGRTPVNVRKPIVYSPIWGCVGFAGLACNTLEADLSGGLSNNGSAAAGQDEPFASPNVTRVNHAPVGPNVPEEGMATQ